jgi:hypothetical protein
MKTELEIKEFIMAEKAIYVSCRKAKTGETKND